jgi:uncharacterized protein YjbJ (UPF0337 family)
MSGKTEHVKGLAEEAAGTLTGDDDLKNRGKADRRTGEAKENIDHAADKVNEVIDKVKDKVDQTAHEASQKLDPK